MRNNKEIDTDKENRNVVFKAIMSELLDNNTTLGGYLGKKLKYTTIDYDILYTTLENNMKLLKYKIPNIPYPIAKVNYIFKVLESQSIN